MAIGDRGPAGRAERVRSSYYSGDQDGDDRDWNSPAGGGLTRILIVVILLHVAGIAGILGYRWLHRAEEGKTDPDPAVSAGKAASSIEEVLPPPPPTNGKAIVVEHPTLKGHVRYRVGKNEQLIDVARRFNASVAEVEKLNNLRSETPLYSGQWLTVPDHRENIDRNSDPVPAPINTAKTKDKPSLDSSRSKDPLPAPEPGPKKLMAQPEPPKADPPKVEPPKIDLPKPRLEPVIPAPVPVPVPVPVAGETYRVNAGDTAYRIALKYGVGWQELLQANGLTDPKQLRAGQVIKIPPKR